MIQRPRLHYLDNLRAFAIVMVIVVHASITYMLYAPEWWYVVDPDQSVIYTMLVLLIDVPNMPALFFVAGFLAFPSILRRGPSGLVREKTIRLAIPWAFGVVFLAPLATYMIYVSRGIPTSYLEFWTGDFWGAMYQQTVYWFLGVLYALFLLLAGAYAASRPLRAATLRISHPRPWFFVAFIALTAAGSVVASPAFGLDDWRPIGLILVVQPARAAFYIGYFALGVYAERRGWLSPAGFQPAIGPWFWGAVLAGIAYLAFRAGGDPTTIPERAAATVLFATFCLAGVVAGLAVFQRWGSGTGRVWRTLAGNSFGIYYVHPLILYPLAYLFVGVGIPSLAKVTILVMVTLLASLAVSALVLRRLPGLRRVF